MENEDNSMKIEEEEKWKARLEEHMRRYMVNARKDPGSREEDYSKDGGTRI